MVLLLSDLKDGTYRLTETKVKEDTAFKRACYDCG